MACVSVSGGPADLRDNGLLGRDQELRALRGVVDDHGGVAVIRGAAGLGKSALLAAAAAYARERGFVVCSTAGVASEVSLPFAALERLLHGLLDRAETLPKPQRDALLSAFGLEETSVT